MQYRREIDGLRSVAVLPVLFFHAGFSAFSGGYVGVDIFFVISGYLITSIISSEINEKRFSIIDFYERRARRLLPALFLVMATCIPFAWFWLLPGDMKDFSQSIVAVLSFASNILFWRESGYFSPDAELKPLLHTWSLAVEEQFYLLFPLFLMLTWRLGRRGVLWATAALVLVSLSLAHWGVTNKPGAAFYLLPTRGWELAIGALVALHMQNGNVASKSPAGVANVLSLTGLLSILYAIFLFDESVPFPGLYALVPTVGTALIILFATPATWVGRGLSSRLPVAIGLISYSAYLWHQPLLAFAKHRHLHEPGMALRGALIIASLALAYLTWRFVEARFRNRSIFTRKHVFAFSGSVAMLLASFGIAGHLSNGHFTRAQPSDLAQDLQYRTRPNHGLSPACEGAEPGAAPCITSTEPEIAIWGDSYAMHLVDGILASNPDSKIVQLTWSDCGPILGLAQSRPLLPPNWSRDCIARNDRVFEYIRSHKSIKYVVLSSPFSYFVEPGKNVLTRDGDIRPGQEVAETHLLRTLASLKEIGVKPIVFSPPPATGSQIGKCLVKATQFHEDKSLCSFALADARRNQEPVNGLLRATEGVSNVVWMEEGICSNGICNASEGEVFVYRDSGHLSHEGSAYLGKRIDFYTRIMAER